MKRGFTLIELLIVIAIMGILASVILSSLQSARDKAADAYVKANLASVAPEAEILYDTSRSYDNVCDDAGIQEFLEKAAERTVGNATQYECVDTAATWAAAVQLVEVDQFGVSSGVDYWCVERGSEPQVIDATTTLAGGTASCS